jgi:DNA (cytosine-5)-methyltransferase 1
LGQGDEAVLLSLFCGAGGLDLGFEEAGFKVGLAFDKKADSVLSYNHNRADRTPVAHVADVTALSLALLDEKFGRTFAPSGVIGGPPCQSFSQANRVWNDNDPRHVLPITFARLLGKLNSRSPVDFFVMENVTGLLDNRHSDRLAAIEDAFAEVGFPAQKAVLIATNYRTAQIRQRIFLVGYNKALFPKLTWLPPEPTTTPTDILTVREKIGALPEPIYFARGLSSESFPVHPNHWCMSPKSKRFADAGLLKEGDGSKRSFKVLSWDKPSYTVAYGNREVHIHPSCHRRLSVYEALILQGFPRSYRLLGSLSSQIAQVSEAVPPLVAAAVADSVATQLAEAKRVQAA